MVQGSDTSVIEGKRIIGTSGYFRVRVFVRNSAEPITHLHIFSISASVKVGTTTPVSVPIFKDYVDIARDHP